jgi:hypothetical protein
MRGPNAVDFWRGYALVCIYIDHIPHTIFASLTMQNFAVSDAAELFVFLAGCSLSFATGGPTRPEASTRVLLRISSRISDIYVAQLAISAIALAIVAAAALGFGDDRFLNLIGAGPLFDQPVEYTLGWVTLTYQLRFFDILPLYIVLLACAAPTVLIARQRLALAVGLSFLLYAVCLVFKINLPTWPGEGSWRFDPLCWQFIFTLGFAAGEITELGKAEQLRARLLWFAVPIAVAGAIIGLIDFEPRASQVVWPQLLFLFDSTYQTPARLLNFLALVVCFGGAFAAIHRHAPKLVGIFCCLGRNSLAVFSVGSLLIVIAHVLHARFGYGGAVATSSTIVGLAVLLFTAWFSEWRRRPRDPVGPA